MKTAYLLLLIFLSYSIKARSQNTDFVLYQFPAKTIVRNNGKDANAKIGMALKKNQEVVLTNSGIVTIICKHFNSYKYNTKRLSVNSLKDTCKKENTSMTASYFKYVWHEFLHGHSEGNERMKYMKNTGGVSRGEGSCPYVSYATWTDKIYYTTGDLFLQWKSSIPTEKQTLQVFEDGIGKYKIFTAQPENNRYNINSLINSVGNKETIFWGVANGNDAPCFLNELVIVSESDAQKEVAAVSALIEEIDEAARAFRLGFMLEEKRYYSLAYGYYKTAVEKAPESGTYKNVLNEFEKLYRISIE